MKPVQITGHVDKNGKLELGELPVFPPDEDLQVLIMDPANIAALEKVIELVADMEGTDPALLEQLEALDEALWDAQFANSPEALKSLAERTYADYKQGKTVELH